MQAVTSLQALDSSKIYTYADYLTWQFKERVELIKGKIMAMSPAPSSNHQRVSYNLAGLFYQDFKGNPCQVFTAPFDVRLSKGEQEVYTVVQPDLCIICDESKLDSRGCVGAPDLVVEILSPGNSKKEMSDKFELYEEAGVLEYWVIRPEAKEINIFLLQAGRYIGLKPLVEGDILHSPTFPMLKLAVNDIFERVV